MNQIASRNECNMDKAITGPTPANASVTKKAMRYNCSGRYDRLFEERKEK